MRFRHSLMLLALFLGPIIHMVKAEAQFGGMLIGTAGGGPPASFTGVGDAKSGAIFHGGVIAYNAAQRGQKMLNLCNAAVCADVFSDATTGLVSSSQTINGAACNTTTHICTAETVYDDSGALACSGGTACNLTVNVGTAPVFVPNASGSLPGLKCNGSTTNEISANITSAHAQPISSGASYSIPSVPGSAGTITGIGNNILQGVLNTGKPFTAAPTVLSQSGTIATSTFVATTSSQDGAGNASISTNDGAATTGAVGSNTIGANTHTVVLCNDAFADHFDGTVLEFFWYAAQFSSGDTTAIVGKQRTNGGF